MTIHGPSWLESVPTLSEITDAVWLRAAQAARIVTVEGGRAVFRERDTCANFLLVLEGSVRVQRTAVNGQVITLYHLEAGQACELTTACLLGGHCYPAEGIAETRVRAALIGKAHFHAAVAQSPKFSRYVFASIDKGVTGLITLVEEVAFGHMDRRLAHCLMQKARSGDQVDATHQELAEELGTAREVVSRVLKDFERRGWVRLCRGQVQLRDRAALGALADKSSM